MFTSTISTLLRVSAAPPVSDTPLAKTLPTEGLRAVRRDHLQVEIVHDRGGAVGRARRLGPDQGHLERLGIAGNVYVVFAGHARGQPIGMTCIQDHWLRASPWK